MERKGRGRGGGLPEMEDQSCHSGQQEVLQIFWGFSLLHQEKGTGVISPDVKINARIIKIIGMERTGGSFWSWGNWFESSNN